MTRGNLRTRDAHAAYRRRGTYNPSQLWRRLYRAGPGQGRYASERVPRSLQRIILNRRHQRIESWRRYTPRLRELQRSFRARRQRIPLARRLELRDATRRYTQTRQFFTTNQFDPANFFNVRGFVTDRRNDPEIIDLM